MPREDESKPLGRGDGNREQDVRKARKVELIRGRSEARNPTYGKTDSGASRVVCYTKPRPRRTESANNAASGAKTTLAYQNSQTTVYRIIFLVKKRCLRS